MFDEDEDTRFPLYQTVPQKIMDDVISVTTGGTHWGNSNLNTMTAAIKTDNSLWVWGYDGNYGDDSIMGNATTMLDGYAEINIQTVPYKLMDDVSAVSIGGSGYRMAIIKTDGSLWVWEYADGWSVEPVKVMDDVISICAGAYCMAAIKSDYSLWLWGEDYGFYDYRYDPDTGEETYGLNISPTPSKVMDDVVSVSIGDAGDSGSSAIIAAIKTDGSLWMWGSNRMGSLGIDTGTESGSGVPLKVMDDVTAVSVRSATAAIKTDGSLWMWGEYSILGNGSTEGSSVPVQIMDDVAEVDVGAGYTIARKTDGSLWMWGDNSLGELGNGGVGNATDQWGDVIQTVPVEVSLADTPDTSSTPNAPTPTVMLSPQNLSVNGSTVNCEKYNIDGANYFKLRDLAYMLNGTGSQFDVGFDATTSTVTITTGKAYTTPNGGELQIGADNSATAQTSRQTIMINGEKRTDLTVYNIGGSNFFQLRELGNALGFDVDYDADTNTAIVLSVQK